MRLWMLLTRRVFFIIFAFMYCLLVLRIHADFGVAIDEPMEYRFGEMLYARNFGKDPVLLRDFAIEQVNSREIWAYNHFHTMLLHIINDTGNLDIYHLLNFFFGLFGLYTVYELVLYATKKPIVGLLGSLSVFFLPRFFGDLASNVKDPVFAIYSLTTLLMISVSSKLKKNPLLRCIIIGVPLGFAAASRTVGYSMVVVFFLFDFLVYLENLIKNMKKIFFLVIQSMLIFCIGLLVHSFQMPFVASNPLRHLVRLIEVAKAYPWDGTMLYLGSTITAMNRPWHYLFVWIGVTTPVFILIFWAISHWFMKNKTILLINICIWVNFVLYLIIHPIIYDGMRHYLFIVVFMAIAALITWYEMWDSENKLKKVILTILLFLNLATVANQYRLLHPYEYVYFNELIGYLPGAYGKFETDYWGTSYFDGANYLKSHFNTIPVSVGLCGNKEASLYFDSTQIHPIWLPTCQIDPQHTPEYLFVMGRFNYWNMHQGEDIYTVSRMNVPLMKIVHPTINAVQ